MRYTENLLLKKPDLADSPPDITVFNENWDKIDEMLKKLPVQNGGLYINDATTEEDKVEATKAIKNFGALVQSGENAYVNPTKDLNNFQTGIGLFNETTLNIPPDDIWWCILSTGAILIDTVVQIAFSLNKKNIKFRSMISGVWEDWSDFRFVPLDGSVPMSGDLAIKNGIGYIRADNNVISIWSYNTIYDKDSRMFMVGNDNANSLQDALILRDYFADSTYKNYRIYGEHNTDLLATAIQSLIDSGVISMSAVKSVQRGIITIAADKTEGTATITAVDTAKAVVLFGGSIYGSASNASYSLYWDARLVLSSATKVTATRACVSSYTATVPYQVLEFV